MLKKIALVVFFVGLTLGCTRDDICPAETPTTPLLIVKFLDFADGEASKSVTGLRVVDATDNTIELISTTTTDSIAIPLRNFSNGTSFNFIVNAGSEDEDEINADEFNLNYTTRDIYLNRACGFITNYDDLTAQIVNEGGTNWMISFEVLTPSVENQDETHITIFH